MVSSDPTNDNSATATEESSLPPSTIASTEGPAKRNKKPRYSKAKKRELQQQRLLREEEERKIKKSKKRKRAKEKTKKKPKSEAPKDEIDRILQCAEKSLFTNSIVVINKSEKIAENNATTNVDNHDNTNKNNTENATEQRRLTVEMISGCDLSEHDHDDKGSAKSEPLSLPSSSLTDILHAKLTCTIKVQPLIVLDLNGILCHRDRKARRATFLESLQADLRFHRGTPKAGSHPITNWDLRRPTGNIANTGIIPRTDLLEFLHYLDKHFCLAIWTSAKTKTAKKLLNLLLSPGDGSEGATNTSHDKYDYKGIRSRLLFVWSQTQCTSVRPTSESPAELATDLPSPAEESTGDDPPTKESKDDDEHSFDGDLVFEKHLPKIWEAYPLWSARNTLLIDDSPEKCSMAVGNAIHPPPLHGRNPRRNSNQNGSFFMTDQENEDRQSSFFRKLVSFWSDCPHRSQPQWDLTIVENAPKDASSRPIGDDSTSVANTNPAYYQFLQRHAKGYMGWREHKI